MLHPSQTTSTAPKTVSFRRTSIELHEYEGPSEQIDHGQQVTLKSEPKNKINPKQQQHEEEQMILENATTWQILLSLWKKWQLHIPLVMIIVTLVQIGLLIAVLVLHGFEQFQLNPMFGPSQTVLLDYGAKNSSLIFSSYTQLWRFFSCIFLQAGVIHLVVNSIWQCIFGIRLELFWSSFRIAPIYFLSGWGSQLLSCILLPNRIGTGSTSAIAGLVGALYADFLINSKSNPHLLTSTLSLGWQTALLFFMTTVIPLIGDNYTTLAGLYIGFAVGLVILPRGFMDTSVQKRKLFPAIFYPPKAIYKDLNSQEEKEEFEEKQITLQQKNNLESNQLHPIQQKRLAFLSLHIILGHGISRIVGVIMLIVYFSVLPGLYWSNFKCDNLSIAPFYSPCWYLSPNWYNLLGIPNQSYPTSLIA